MINQSWAKTLVEQIEQLRKDAPFSKIEVVLSVHESMIKKFEVVQHKKFCFGGSNDE